MIVGVSILVIPSEARADEVSRSFIRGSLSVVFFDRDFSLWLAMTITFPSFTCPPAFFGGFPLTVICPVSIIFCTWERLRLSSVDKKVSSRWLWASLETVIVLGLGIAILTSYFCPWAWMESPGHPTGSALGGNHTLCACLDLNRGPLPYKGSALTTELQALVIGLSVAKYGFFFKFFLYCRSIAKNRVK